jgi:hypothetical protein
MFVVMQEFNMYTTNKLELLEIQLYANKRDADSIALQYINYFYY